MLSKMFDEQCTYQLYDAPYDPLGRCVMSLENMTQGCVKVQLWCDKATDIGASMSIVLVVKLVHTPIVRQQSKWSVKNRTIGASKACNGASIL